MKAPGFLRRIGLRLGGESARMLPQARVAGPMPWVVAIMIALTVMAAAAGLALNNIATNARSEIDGGITVQVIEGAPAARERQTQRVLALLTARRDVASVRRVPDAELAALLEPWLGAAASNSEDLPTPTLIDVRLKGPVSPSKLAQLREDLQSAVPAARLDAQAGWLAPVFDAIRSLQVLALGLVVLLGATSVAAVWLASRSALGANRPTIEVIHHLGGSDPQIARIFQRSIGWDAALGGMAGLALGLGAIFVLGQQFARLGSGLVAGGTLHQTDWLIICAVPLTGVVLAILTARLTVLGALKRQL